MTWRDLNLNFFREDVESARHLATDEEKRILWGDIAGN